MASDETLEVATLRDNYGDEIDFATEGSNVRIVFNDDDGHMLVMLLDAAKQEEFAQLYVAACHQAKVNAEAGRQAEASPQ